MGMLDYDMDYVHMHTEQVIDRMKIQLNIMLSSKQQNLAYLEKKYEDMLAEYDYTYGIRAIANKFVNTIVAQIKITRMHIDLVNNLIVQTNMLQFNSSPYYVYQLTIDIRELYEMIDIIYT